ncbi:hypothetical protein LTR78_001274 [Recurvomyces mirabilis]|uniref:Carboxylic ester hydrolase n=1 Tax=Recurvomyces mirabilis TaxID=574656 RepID=A0AAE0WVB3_9PEZI|nr:hypothetical protein LTR78_001274 [Recurvomyces mirabilis]KAK5161251.1 hypothetical protein LTS14_001047 [Recurvomyces mirabilis]
MPSLCTSFTSILAVVPLCYANRRLTRCSATQLEHPVVFGAQITSVTATHVHPYSTSSTQNGAVPAANYTNLNFCNIKVTYTHPGYNDIIHVNVWLPSEWNGRFQGTGGGGWITGHTDQSLAPAIAQGYAAASTDGGHTESGDGMPETWALLSPGNVNHNLLQDFASVALNDMTVIGKAITTSYYGSAPTFSYWNGCSTGGR